MGCLLLERPCNAGGVRQGPPAPKLRPPRPEPREPGGCGWRARERRRKQPGPAPRRMRPPRDMGQPSSPRLPRTSRTPPRPPRSVALTGVRPPVAVARPSMASLSPPGIPEPIVRLDRTGLTIKPGIPCCRRTSPPESVLTGLSGASGSMKEAPQTARSVTRAVSASRPGVSGGRGARGKFASPQLFAYVARDGLSGRKRSVLWSHRRDSLLACPFAEAGAPHHRALRHLRRRGHPAGRAVARSPGAAPRVGPDAARRLRPVGRGRGRAGGPLGAPVLLPPGGAGQGAAPDSEGVGRAVVLRRPGGRHHRGHLLLPAPEAALQRLRGRVRPGRGAGLGGGAAGLLRGA